MFEPLLSRLASGSDHQLRYLVLGLTLPFLLVCALIKPIMFPGLLLASLFYVWLAPKARLKLAQTLPEFRYAFGLMTVISLTAIIFMPAKLFFGGLVGLNNGLMGALFIGLSLNRPLPALRATHQFKPRKKRANKKDKKRYSK